MYRPTTDLYRLMSDLSFDVPGAYAKREMCYHFYLFPYYTEDDRTKLRNYILDSLNKTEIFVGLM